MPVHNKRSIQVAVISDLHLGMRGCHAEALLNYLKSIKPEVLILNGDIIDIWQFKKKYFPPKIFLNKLYKKFTPYCSVATWYLWRSIDNEPIQY